MAAQERPYEPPLAWRATSAATLGIVGLLCRSFLYAFNRTETTGLDRFLNMLDERKDEQGRTRGLITVSNHVSVLDDPMIWGVLPHKYFWNSKNMRYSLGSFDICFKNGQRSLLSAFFTYGNTLPTHRSAHSKFGGLFQPTMTQCIKLLSDPHSVQAQAAELNLPEDKTAFPSTDPFSSSALYYSTNGEDSFPAPAAYPSRRHSWIHIFPEGMIHQHPDKVMRYFKWGVARLILEAEPCPDVMPMWIDGPQHVMDNERGFPKPLPRIGKDISVNFGEVVDREKVFEPYRQRWREMKERARRKRLGFFQHVSDHDVDHETELGLVIDDDLKYGKEAEQLRIDVTMAVRNEVLKVRRACSGLPDEDPKRSLAETFRSEGTTAREGPQKDGSSLKDT
ncbi:hypothetical protein DOTSEDRAFT_71434 [Dothistroma septosporum NZE10]|uniref:Tafazzin family protein n=1 Tax=Dothistroma septosporum (strain NZE10 / CBS 128990) TaxID=675120 RepID=N1PQS4_DOTSN|nr:hypothetical protein DOTSEDRAFT_71434 [Dothistroma septosporum NZE10]